MPGTGIAAVEARVNDIRLRFEPPPVATEPAATESGTDFAQVMDLLVERGAPGATPLGLTPYSSPILGARQLAAPLGRGGAVVESAMQYLGVPYLWGGTDPAQGLDCSGFVQRVHRDLGIELPRVSRDQARGGQPVASLAEAQPGDVVASGEPVNHVAIYGGNGQMVHAPRRGDVVKVEPIDRPITAIRRYTGATPANLGVAPLPGLHAASYGSPVGAGSVTSVPYANLFNLAGVRHGVDPRLLAAVAQVESGFNPSAVSRAGAQGLMQFMPGTAAGLGIDPLDPAQAVDGAARYLRSQLDRFGSVELALAAYNAGPGAVSRHGGIPPYAE